MKPTNLLIILMVLGLRTGAVGAQDFEFAVRHHHTLKDCRGTLRFSAEGIEYRTTHTKDARKWKYSDIRVITVQPQNKVALLTYEDQKRFLGKDREFEFSLLEGEVPLDLSAFLLSKVARPMALPAVPQAGKPAFELPVKHLETFGGARGMLRIYPDRVVYESSRERDSRIWRLKDIQRFGQPDRFRFQIVGYVPKAGGPTEVYNFELLEDLPEGLYDYLWVRLHPSTYYPETQPE